MQQNIKTSLGVAVIIIIAFTAGFFTWKVMDVKKNEASAPQQNVSTKDQEPKACTMEAKQCADGSYVSRTGPNCEFVACPVETSNVSNEVIYKNTDYGFQVTLPKEWAKSQVSIQRDEGDDKHTYFYFMLPTTEKSWNGSYDRTTGGVIKGMVNIFVITANDLTTWNKDLNSTECKENPNPSCPYEGSVIAKNGKYVFDASYGNGLLPPDVQKFRDENPKLLNFLSGKFKLLD